MALGHDGVEHVVLERNRVASTWAQQRWDSFRLNTPGWMNSMLGPVEQNAFARRDEVVALLTDRAADLPVQTDTPVVALDRDGSGFVVRTPDEQIRAATVVLASGMQNVPRVPTQADRLSPDLFQIHAGAYRSAAQLPEGAVLVVGGGQSGCQIAEDLVVSGRRVYLSTSRVGRLPWNYRGWQLLGWVIAAGFYDQRPEDLPTPTDVRIPIPVLASGGRSLDLRILARLGVTLLGHLESCDVDRVTLRGTVGDNIAYADEVATRFRGLADDFIARHGIDAPEAEPETDLEPFAQVTVTDLDLRSAGITSVVWCTGFTGDLSWVHFPITDAAGTLRHDRCASPVPGLWYAGFPWLTRRQSGILYGFPVDAREIAAAVVSQLAGAGVVARPGQSRIGGHSPG